MPRTPSRPVAKHVMGCPLRAGSHVEVRGIVCKVCGIAGTFVAMTVLEVIQSTTAYFENHGVDSPRLQIEHLLAHVLGKRRIDLYMEFDRPLSGSELEPLRELVRRRAGGEPLQHLLGTVEFCGREFLCDRRALIPRPETEQLVELAVELCPTPHRMLDLCTGSGVVAVSLALMLPDVDVVASDLSGEALGLAVENAERLGVAERIRWVECDLFPESDGKFELIAANPPYIPSGELDSLPGEVRHDPAMALDGGADGLDFIRRIAAEAAPRLQEGGVVVMEIGHDQSEDASELLRQANWGNISTHLDYQKVPRFISARHG